jgi:hypothetical protein
MKRMVIYLLIVAAILLLQIPLMALQSPAKAWTAREGVGSPVNVNIPPHKAFIRAFDLNARGRIKIDYTVQSGQMDIYLMTQEQENRASAGHEPAEIGRDFITKSFGVVGTGSTISPDLNPGRYSVIFRNSGESAIQVTAKLLAEAR